MKQLNLDAAVWRTPLDVSKGILLAIGAPKWNGTSIQALLDALIWDETSRIKPPYKILISNVHLAPADVVNEIHQLKDFVDEACEEFKKSHGRQMKVSLEIHN